MRLSSAGVRQPVLWGAGRTGPGGTSRGQDGITRPGVWWVSSVPTAGATNGRADAIRGEPGLSPADALPGLTRLRLGHAAALVELSPMAVPDAGFCAAGIGQADSKLAVLVASAAGMGCPSSDLPRQIAN
jgi:hypothetical protein